MSNVKIKKTPARSNVLNFLNSVNSPVDIEQIIKYLRSKELNTNKVTVYRIIEYLFKNKIVSRLDFAEGKFRYEIKKDHHHHLICEKCQSVEDVKGEYMDNLEKIILKQEKFIITGHSLEFFGICKNCQS